MTAKAEHVPESLRDIVKGVDFPGDSGVAPDVPPPWLDRAKFERGQAFARKNFFSLAYAEVLSLIINFLFPGELQPLIFTQRSSTVYTSYRRYLDTVNRVKTWYEADPWKVGSVAYQNMATVRGYHLDASRRLTQLAETDPDTLRLNTTFGLHSDPPRVERLCEDARAATCPSDYVDAVLKDRDVTTRVHLNQFDMSLTQFAFSGLLVTFPERFGLHGNLERELDAFCHRTRDVLEYLVRPRLRTVNRDWEHMLRVLFEGLGLYVPGTSFDASMLFLMETMGVPAPRLSAQLSRNSRLITSTMAFFMEGVMRVPSVRTWANQELANNLRRTNSNSVSSRYTDGIRRRSYRYEFLPFPGRYHKQILPAHSTTEMFHLTANKGFNTENLSTYNRPRQK
ncbi:hypothetical protein FOCC_FOCC005204 [Frankliniella occidentalis]|nr:hypothetical protein FOCC_FOCC005204 [Frankliniella occidentalis]